ncbi:MAG: HNH endonuclease [Pseudomonadota bacterium]|nr:HNH endonuclease [Pseudomonadota bacterium]
MNYAVFDTKAQSTYDDKIEERYHFPSRYLETARSALGSWIIYREPRADGGRLAYFAAARLDRIEQDQEQDNHYYALVSEFTEFDQEVSWRTEAGEYREQWLRDLSPKEVGVKMRGSSVRSLGRDDFLSITTVGLRESAGIDLSESSSGNTELPERRTISMLVNTKARGAGFRRRVLSAYSNTCAFTGFSVLDTNGNPEVEAAHIRSVEHGGPDYTNNGIALCRTAHWLFDRYLVTISDDHKLIYNTRNLPVALQRILKPKAEKILLPTNSHFNPSLRFIRFHRELYQRHNT